MVSVWENTSKSAYESFDDTLENVRKICVPAVELAVSLFGRALVTTGVKNMWEYPKPNHIGSIYYPSATGCNAWGFSGWQPMFFYGKCPYLQNRMGSRIDSFSSSGVVRQPKSTGILARNQLSRLSGW